MSHVALYKYIVNLYIVHETWYSYNILLAHAGRDSTAKSNPSRLHVYQDLFPAQIEPLEINMSTAKSQESITLFMSLFYISMYM